MPLSPQKTRHYKLSLLSSLFSLSLSVRAQQVRANNNDKTRSL